MFTTHAHAAKFCHILPTLNLANQDFPSPGWKIAIGSLTTSALAASRYVYVLPLTTDRKDRFAKSRFINKALKVLEKEGDGNKVVKLPLK